MQFSATGNPTQFYEVKLSATGSPIQFYEVKLSATGSPMQFYEVQFSATGSTIQFYEVKFSVKFSATGCPNQFYEAQLPATGNFDGVQFSANPSLSQFYCYFQPGLASRESTAATGCTISFHLVQFQACSGGLLFCASAVCVCVGVSSIPLGGKLEQVRGGSSLSHWHWHPIL